MIKAKFENRKVEVEISGGVMAVREEILRIGESVSRIPSQKLRDELVHAFIKGAFGDPDVRKDKPDFDELIHSDEEG